MLGSPFPTVTNCTFVNNTGIKANASITELYQDDRQCETDALGGVWFSVCDRGMLEFEANGSKYNATLLFNGSLNYNAYNKTLEIPDISFAPTMKSPAWVAAGCKRLVKRRAGKKNIYI